MPRRRTEETITTRDDTSRSDPHAAPSGQTAARYEPWAVPRDAREPLLSPARDTLTGGRVSLLEVTLPRTDADTVARRVQAYAGVRHACLAEVRAVERSGALLRVVCEPLQGRFVLASKGTALTVRSVQRLSVALLDALTALHRSGVVHGCVTPASLLLTRGNGAGDGVDLTLLPLPWPAPRASAEAPDVTGAASASRDDDVAAAASVMLALLRRAPVTGLEESVLAAALARELQQAGRLPSSEG